MSNLGLILKKQYARRFVEDGKTSEVRSSWLPLTIAPKSTREPGARIHPPIDLTIFEAGTPGARVAGSHGLPCIKAVCRCKIVGQREVKYCDFMKHFNEHCVTQAEIDAFVAGWGGDGHGRAGRGRGRRAAEFWANANVIFYDVTDVERLDLPFYMVKGGRITWAYFSQHDALPYDGDPAPNMQAHCVCHHIRYTFSMTFGCFHTLPTLPTDQPLICICKLVLKYLRCRP